MSYEFKRLEIVGWALPTAKVRANSSLIYIYALLLTEFRLDNLPVS